MDSLAQIISEYNQLRKEKNPKVNYELEIRFQVNKENLISIFNILNEKYQHKITRSQVCTNKNINENIRSSNVQDFDIINNKLERTNMKYFEKLILKKCDNSTPINHRISLAKETIKEPFKINLDSTIRFRFRCTFIIDKWQIDLTAIKHSKLNDLASGIKNVQNRLLLNDNFIDTLKNNTEFSSYEFEAEYLDNTLSTEIITECVNNIYSLINKSDGGKQQYINSLVALAKTLSISQSIINSISHSEAGLKKIINQAISLDASKYADMYPPAGYYLTDKADGLRGIYFSDNHTVRLFKGTECIILATNVNTNICVFDGEVIERDGQMQYLLFDVLIVNGVDYSLKPFTDRLSLLTEAAKIATKYIKSNPKIYNYLTVDNYSSVIKEVYEKKSDYKIDGLIFTNPKYNYYQTTNYKWKPTNENTIDFMLVNVPKTLLGTKPYIEIPKTTLYILMSSINYKTQQEIGLSFMPNYKDVVLNISQNKNFNYPIQFSPSINPYAYLYWHPNDSPVKLTQTPTIVEMKPYIDHKIPKWEILRERVDRINEASFYGNAFPIAESIYQSIYNPLELDSLIMPKKGYFSEAAPPAYKAANSYKRFVIESVFKANLNNAKWIVDLASGRGADLRRYQRYGIKNILFVDVDAMAISELITRKYSKFNLKHKPEKLGGGTDNNFYSTINNFNVYALIQDLTEDPKLVLDNIEKYGIVLGTVDGVVCNFAFHYFCDNALHVKQLIEVIKKLLKIGGIFIMTVMNGERVFNKLQTSPDKKSFILVEDGTEKYIIKSRFSGSKLANTGQTIDVKLPFANDLYSEPLCNTEFIIKEFSNNGFSLELNNNFIDQINKFDKKLSEQDQEYIKLHQYISLRKIK